MSKAALGADEHMRSLRVSEGSGAALDWNLALDHALHAAEDGAGKGHALARATLAGLAGDWSLATRILGGEAIPADWRSLRAAIDLAAWKRTPPPRVISASPRVGLVEGAASPEICDWLIARAKPGLIPARVYDPGTGGPAVESIRTNSERYFPFPDRDLIFNLVRHRISVATGLPVRAMEAPTILHYLPGQEFKPHHDYLNPAASGYAKEIVDRGQRVLTFLLCLNDDYEGGETEFPLLARRFKGKKGNALFFWNVSPEGLIDQRTLHAGLPPARGEKWMLSQWIRDRADRDSIDPAR